MTSPRVVARMVDGAVRKAAVGRARSAQVRFNGLGIPDLITFADGSSTPPLFATHTSTMMPGGASPAGLALPMLVIPLDGGGWAPVSYMPTLSDYLVTTTVRLPVQTLWHKAAPWSGPGTPWTYQATRTGPASIAWQGFQWSDEWRDPMTNWFSHVSIAHFGDVPSLIPSGATVHAVKLALTRLPEQTEGDPMSTAIPEVHGHTYTPAAPPVAGQTPVLSAASVTGAPMRVGDVQQIDVWATDLMTGAIKGLALGSTSTTRAPDSMQLQGLELLVTYSGVSVT